MNKLSKEEKAKYAQQLQNAFDNYDTLALCNICEEIKLRLDIRYAPIKLKDAELLMGCAKLLGFKWGITPAPKSSFTETYKGYIGRAVWDAEAKLYHGDVLHIKDVITFQGKNKKEARKAFKGSIDDYMLWLSTRK